MRDRFGLLFALLLINSFADVALLPAKGHAQERVALVIGNGEYLQAPALPTAASDAASIGQSLERLGFSVTSVTDVRFDEFRHALLAFGRAAHDAQMAVIYFSGHGLEMDGENWLVPVDAELKSDIDVDGETIGLRSLMLSVASARDLGLVILDACRNNPFGSTMRRSIRARAIDRGLARVEPSDNVLVAFAAMDGTTAVDASGPHSPFAEAVLANLETPGLEVNFLFRNIRDDVLAATHGAQQPFVYGSLSKREIYLKPAVGPSEAAAAPTADDIAWSFLKNTTDLPTLRRFLDRFPSGAHQSDAKVRIAALEQAAANPDAVNALASNPVDSAAKTVSSPSNLSDAEVARPFLQDTPDIETAWDVLKESTDAPMLRRFVNQFPAKHRIDQVAALEHSNRGILPLAVGECDRLAADPSDETRPAGISGVEFSALEPDRAVAVCRRAVAEFPDDARLKFELCRALAKAGKIAEAAEMCREAYEAAHGPACMAADLYGAFISGLNLKKKPDDHKKTAASHKKKLAKTKPNADPQQAYGPAVAPLSVTPGVFPVVRRPMPLRMPPPAIPRFYGR
jgi:hypothetical protein